MEEEGFVLVKKNSRQRHKLRRKQPIVVSAHLCNAANSDVSVEQTCHAVLMHRFAKSCIFARYVKGTSVMWPALLAGLFVARALYMIEG